jgi:hypothetical protein
MDVLVRLLPALILLAIARPALAKPHVLVVARIAAADNSLRSRIADDLPTRAPAEVEPFLAKEFASELGRSLKMFEFVTSGSAPLTITFELRSHDPAHPFPAGDVDLFMSAPSFDPIVMDHILLRPGCTGTISSCTSNYVQTPLYRDTLHAVLKTWPKQLSQIFHSIPVITQASYKRGEIEAAVSPIELGETALGVPNSLFEILYKTTRRPFAICGQRQNGLRSLGKEQISEASVSCTTGLASHDETAHNGIVSVMKVWVLP